MSHLLVTTESKFGYMLETLEYLRGNPTSVTVRSPDNQQGRL